MEDFSGFYKLSIDDRLKRLKSSLKLTDSEVETLKDSGSLSLSIADRWIENVIGATHLPLGIATHFKINGKNHVIPMSVEEPSVIAAASRAAKQTLPKGFTAEADEPIMIGQLQILGVPDIPKAMKKLEEDKKEVLSMASQYIRSSEKYGAGVRDFSSRALDSSRGKILLLEFYIDVRDAMGANMVNTVLEGVTETVLSKTGGRSRLRIISNLATRRKVRAHAIWKKEIIGENVIEGLLDGYALAEVDVYRCSTHNKGIMNGISSVAIATGNDWRAVEAGAHAYASLNGYHPLTHYEVNSRGNLVGSIELPLAVATVGGAIATSPTAKIALKIADVKTSKELAMLMACVGLANNFAALSALGTVGIQNGHMKLHARNIAVASGAKTADEIDAVAKILIKNKDFSTDVAKEILKKIRGEV